MSFPLVVAPLSHVPFGNSTITGEKLTGEEQAQRIGAGIFGLAIDALTFYGISKAGEGLGRGLLKEAVYTGVTVSGGEVISDVLVDKGILDPDYVFLAQMITSLGIGSGLNHATKIIKTNKINKIMELTNLSEAEVKAAANIHDDGLKGLLELADDGKIEKVYSLDDLAKKQYFDKLVDSDIAQDAFTKYVNDNNINVYDLDATKAKKIADKIKGSGERIIPGTDGVVTGGNSTKLGKNMLKEMGVENEKWSGYQAQHVFPAETMDHPVIQKVGMDFDDASNGLFLRTPDGAVSTMSRHKGYHSVYNEFVNMKLDQIDINQSSYAIQQQLADLQAKLKELQMSGLPLYPSQGATIDLWEKWFNKLEMIIMENINIDLLTHLLYGSENDEIIRVLRDCNDVKLLYVFMYNYNWDNGFEIPYTVINNVACDLSVALLTFYRADGSAYLLNKDSSQSLVRWREFIETLYTKIIDGDYICGIIEFKPPLSKIELFKLKKVLTEKENIFVESFGSQSLDVDL